MVTGIFKERQMRSKRTGRLHFAISGRRRFISQDFVGAGEGIRGNHVHCIGYPLYFLDNIERGMNDELVHVLVVITELPQSQN
jgi:hypothetical protein